MSPTMVLAIGCTPPAPSPWMARNATSCAMECAKPHSVEPSRNSSGAERRKCGGGRRCRRAGHRPGWLPPGSACRRRTPRQTARSRQGCGDAGHRGGDDRGLDRRHETRRHAGGQDQLPARQRNGRSRACAVALDMPDERRPLRAERYYQIVGHVGLQGAGRCALRRCSGQPARRAPIPPHVHNWRKMSSRSNSTRFFGLSNGTSKITVGATSNWARNAARMLAAESRCSMTPPWVIALKLRCGATTSRPNMSPTWNATPQSGATASALAWACRTICGSRSMPSTRYPSVADPSAWRPGPQPSSSRSLPRGTNRGDHAEEDGIARHPAVHHLPRQLPDAALLEHFDPQVAGGGRLPAREREHSVHARFLFERVGQWPRPTADCCAKHRQFTQTCVNSMLEICKIVATR